MQGKFCMLLLFVAGACLLDSVRGQLFGTSGTLLHRNDDSFSAAITIPGFPFFGVTQYRLFVCTNGIISFGSGVSSFTPTPFPTSDNPLVAPFWGDVDTNRGGDIYYREASASDRNDLTIAVGLNGFTATWGYIVSWVNVAAYGGGGPRNTFQASLVTDGRSSFVIFNFQSLAWTGSSGSVPSQTGFDAGNYRNFYAHEWSRTANIINLPSSTNVGVMGRYIYGVGAAVIVPIEEVVVDPCAGVVCQNGGTCNGGNCNCRTGYEGNRCQTVINWCSRNGINCNNHGTCSNNAANTGWQCACYHAGYSGTQCEVVRNWCSYSGINCNNRGTCTNNVDNSNWQCSCRHAGYNGDQCQNIRDWCSYEGQTCSGHGTCSNAADNIYWQCTCRHAGYYGTRCENIVDWCSRESEDCNRHGTCSNTADNDWWTCSCYQGFRDTYCDDQLCLGGLWCHNNGVCGPSGCECLSPYAGDECLEENPACTGIDCGHGSCYGSGQCQCHTGYAQLSSTSLCTGQQCGGFICYNGGSCVNGVCVCAVGWLGSTCEEVDLCAGSTCNEHGQCVVFNGAPVCRCDDVSFGPQTGPLEQQCSQQQCSNVITCYNGGVCNVASGGCNCVYPYTGAYCQQINYCSGINCVYGTCSEVSNDFLCNCQSTQIWADPFTGYCTTTVCPGGYQFCRNTASCQAGGTCSCPAGYSGDNCEIWDACYGVTCMNGGICRDNQHNGGDYLCDCGTGFHGRHCELQRCTSSTTCYNGGHCTDTGCNCPVEWTGADCQTPVPSVCQYHYCGAGGTCSGTASAVCTCAAGYEQECPSCACNLLCADLQCQNGGVCSAEFPICQCPPGFYGETCGLASPCGSVECHYARGSCGDYQGDLASCQCVLPIYTGDDCSTHICSAGYAQAQCLNGGSCTPGGCECVYPYTGSTCERTELCPEDYCVHGSCSISGDAAVCTCDAGYIHDERTGLCTTQYLCANGVTFCMHNGVCNAAGTGCICPPEYTGNNCEQRDLCEGNTCVHGTCVLRPEVVSYYCNCDEGWVGGNCDIRRCTNSLICQNGAVCGIDGCTCAPGWTGADCTIPMDPACYSEIENYDCGHGNCATGGVCECATGYTRDINGRCYVVTCGGIICQNGASCQSGECDCPPGYLGDDCSNTGCIGVDCGANGFCELMNDNSNMCICDDPRWTGSRCEFEHCTDGSTCQNGGSCVNGGTSTSACACLPGFSGTDCGSVDPCEGRVCSHGTCVVVNNGLDFYCRCETGYVLDPDTNLCTQQLCVDGNAFCLNNQPCRGPASCDCSAPYSGTNCENVDYCYQRDCSNHGMCREALDAAGHSMHRHECVCLPGYHGSDCQYEYCIEDIVCFNGGTCTSQGCMCTMEWQGPSCEVPMLAACTQHCDNGECNAAGACVCYEGFVVGSTGICDAEAPVDGQCLGTTCFNGGSCFVVRDRVTGIEDAICVCRDGWTGADCSEVDGCANYDCSDHGSCVMYQDTTPRCVCDDPRYVDSSGAHLDCDRETCANGASCNNGGSCQGDGSCLCPYPFEGARCETRNVCPTERCVHGICSDGSGDFVWNCECFDGYIYNEITGFCDVMLCADYVNRCLNGGTCVDGATTSTCTCPEGITGDNCEIVNFCYNVDCHSGYCENFETHYECRCQEGFIGTHCELQNCLHDITCFNDGVCTQDGCVCTDLYEGPSCEIRRATPCEGIDCANGHCVAAGGSYVCVCDTGFSHDAATAPCTAAICTTLSCQNGGSCLTASDNDPERCQCMPGYLGTNCEIVTCANVDCHGHGRCVVLPNGAGQCVCDHSRWTHTAGAEAAPGDCAVEVLNEVSCQNGGSCVDFCTASPPCSCPWPFVGETCETSSPCDDSHNTCVHGTCFPEARDGRVFYCDCDEGYIVDQTTGHCATELCDASFCMHGGVCNDDQVSCSCPPGTTGDNCEFVDYCYGHDCTGNGRCLVIDGSDYYCSCNDGWIGTDCDLQRCVEGLTCFNGGSCRTDFGCDCLDGFGGPSCETVYTEACTNMPCVHGECVESGEAATCQCYDTWGGDDCNRHVCTDGQLACQNGGTCTDGVDDVVDSLFPDNVCHCVALYGGDDCSAVDLCNGVTCNHHGRCLAQNEEAVCACDDARWSGQFCETETSPTTGIVCQNGGSVSADGESCVCNFPHSGTHCENTDWCLDNPCVNGFCAVVEDGFECDCYDGFILDINNVCVTQLCADGQQFCLNGGSCIDWETYNTCSCPPGVTGANCETVDHCHLQDCNELGLCENRVDGAGFTCHCNEGFLGQDCSIQRCVDFICLNGGICGQEGCLCTAEWSGDSCEIPVDPNCQNVECGAHETCDSSGTQCTTANDAPLVGFASLWTARSNDLAQYHTVDLGTEKIIMELVSAGGADSYVTSFTAEISTNGSNWRFIPSRANAGHRLFECDNTETVHTLDRPLIARYVRINPRTWWMNIVMSAQVLGCDYNQTGTCVCSDGYTTNSTGACVIDICGSGFTCLNGGTCFVADDGQPACNCVQGFNGRDCSTAEEEAAAEESSAMVYGAAGGAAGLGALGGIGASIYRAVRRRRRNAERPSSSEANDIDVEDLEAQPNSVAPRSANPTNMRW